MPADPAVAARRPGAIDRRLAWVVQRRIAASRVRLVLWDGSSPSESRDAIGDLLVADRRVLAGLAFYPDLYFGEAYMSGRLDVRGPFEPVLEALARVESRDRSWRERIELFLYRRTTLTDARRNVHHHYDLGNEFYEQWLDADLVYTCAYFTQPSDTLETAQRAKLDLVCRKLCLRPGDTVVEAGCGWGALAIHMAREYGARVKAFNVSREQLAYARERAAREGLSGRVEFIDDDYRNIRGTFDVFVSVGMLEHVGPHQFDALSDVIRRAVSRERGRGLLHFIGRDAARPLNAWIRRRIFPGAYPPTLAEVVTRVLTPAGMSVQDVENLRLHYARTLAHWRERFDRVADAVRSRHGREFERAWRLYLAGSEATFATGWLQLFQVTFGPADTRPPYWTRAAIYDAPLPSDAPM